MRSTGVKAGLIQTDLGRRSGSRRTVATAAMPNIQAADCFHGHKDAAAPALEVRQSVGLPLGDGPEGGILEEVDHDPQDPEGREKERVDQGGPEEAAEKGAGDEDHQARSHAIGE